MLNASFVKWSCFVAQCTQQYSPPSLIKETPRHSHTLFIPLTSCDAVHRTFRSSISQNTDIYTCGGSLCEGSESEQKLLMWTNTEWHNERKSVKAFNSASSFHTSARALMLITEILHHYTNLSFNTDTHYIIHRWHAQLTIMSLHIKQMKNRHSLIISFTLTCL